jgi:hypothetical protein
MTVATHWYVMTQSLKNGDQFTTVVILWQEYNNPEHSCLQQYHSQNVKSDSTGLFSQ